MNVPVINCCDVVNVEALLTQADADAGICDTMFPGNVVWSLVNGKPEANLLIDFVFDSGVPSVRVIPVSCLRKNNQIAVVTKSISAVFKTREQLPRIALP